MFSRRGLAACFCALSAPELTQDPFIRTAPIADWAYWRDAIAAGHEVAPHGFAHEHLGKLAIEHACDSVRRSLDTFEHELPGFDARESVYHLAYLAAPASVVDWIGRRTLGARMALGGAGLKTRRSGLAEDRSIALRSRRPTLKCLRASASEGSSAMKTAGSCSCFTGSMGKGGAPSRASHSNRCSTRY